MGYALEQQNPAPVVPLQKYKTIGEFRVEENIESRLRDLTDILEGLFEAPYPGLVMERSRLRKTLEELAAKEVALRWMVRVARHSGGATKRRLWAHIGLAVADLENVAESLLQAESAGGSLPLQPVERHH